MPVSIINMLPTNPDRFKPDPAKPDPHIELSIMLADSM